MKEEIERRRAEAAEKRQKVEDIVDGEERPFKCVSPRGSSLKVGPPPNRRSLSSSAVVKTGRVRLTLPPTVAKGKGLSRATAHLIGPKSSSDRRP